MEGLSNEQNLALVRSALKRASWEVVVSMMDDEKVKKTFDAAVTQTLTSVTVVQAVAKVLAS